MTENYHNNNMGKCSILSFTVITVPPFIYILDVLKEARWLNRVEKKLQFTKEMREAYGRTHQ
jgi:hypothetical protein